MQQGIRSIIETSSSTLLYWKINIKHTNLHKNKTTPKYKILDFWHPQFLMMHNCSVICHHLAPIQFTSICVHPQKIPDTVLGYNRSKPCVVGLATCILQWSNFGEKIKIITQILKGFHIAIFIFSFWKIFTKKMLIRNCQFKGFF